MAQYISKSALVAEIERLKTIYKDDENIHHVAKYNILVDILSFLNTLEVKENNNVWHDARKTIPEDGSEQIICIKEDGLAVSTVGKIVNGTIKWAYLGDLLDTNSFNVEVKEINNVWNDASDFPKAEAGRSILFIEDNGYIGLLKSPSAERLFYFHPTNLKMWAYVDELISMTTHFKVKEVDLDKEVANWWKDHYKKIKNDYKFEDYNGHYMENSTIISLAQYFFELGLKAKGE